jgi:Brix domain
MVLMEKSKICNGLTISMLPHGPTAFFKLTSVVTHSNIPHVGKVTSHVPELNLNGFGTRLGHRVGRFFASCFPPPVLKGRQVITFHNQRDFIFVRQHRYIFKDKTPTTATATTSATTSGTNADTATAAAKAKKPAKPPAPLDPNGDQHSRQGQFARIGTTVYTQIALAPGGDVCHSNGGI